MTNRSCLRIGLWTPGGSQTHCLQKIRQGRAGQQQSIRQEARRLAHLGLNATGSGITKYDTIRNYSTDVRRVGGSWGSYCKSFQDLWKRLMKWHRGERASTLELEASSSWHDHPARDE